MGMIQQTRLESGNTQVMIVQWVGLAAGDTGEPVPFSQYADKSVQVAGAFGVSGSVVIEGTIDGIHWNVLHDPQGIGIAINQEKIEAITEAVAQIRPRVTTGDASTSLTVTMLMKGV